MAITLDGISVNGQKATFRPEDILSGDASAYTEEIGTAVEEWLEENVTGGEQVTDTTLTLPGVPADAEATGNKIDELKEDLNALPSVNDSDAEDVDLDVSDTQGNVLVRFKNGHIETKNFNSAAVGQALLTIEEDLNAVEADVTRLPSVKDSDVEGVDLDVSDAQGNVIVRFKNGHIETKNFKSEELSPTVITLKADGTGNFSTLRAALDSITDADPDTKPYEIHVYPGTYNTLEGYTDAEIRSADIGGGYSDTSMVGAKATNGISIIGIGDRESIIFTAELATADYPLAVRGNISTLNMQGTGRFENLTILAKNIRYCVHDDFRCMTPYKRIVKNCVFRGSALSYNPPTTYGAGISYGGITALFEDCDFGFDWGMHNRPSMANDSVVILRHCTGHCIRVNDSSNDADKGIHHYIVDSCNFLKMTFNKTNGTIPHILVDGTDSEDIMCFAPSTVIPQVGQLLKQKVSTVTIGSLVEFADDASYVSLATNKDSAIGVLVARDTNYDYVQTKGYINASQIGLSDLAVGDYIGVDASMKLVKVESASDAIGVVKYNSSSVAQIKIWRWS